MVIRSIGYGIDAWNAIPTNSIKIGSSIDISNSYQSTLSIDVALGSNTSHIGSKIIIQVSPLTGIWTDLSNSLILVGTNSNASIADNPLVLGSTTINVGNTSGFETGLANLTSSILVFLLDVNNVVNSELIQIVSCIKNTSVTISDGVINSHNISSSINNMVQTYEVELPLGISKVRIVYDNTYSTSGPTLYSRSRLVKVVEEIYP